MTIQSRPPVQDRQLYLYLQQLATQSGDAGTSATTANSGLTALRNEMLAEIVALKRRVSDLEEAVEQIDSGSGELDIEAVMASVSTQTALSVSELAEAPLSLVVFAQSELVEAALSGVQTAERDEVSGTCPPAAVEALVEFIVAPYPEY